VKSSKSKGKNNARTRKGLKPTSGGGAGVVGCVGSPAWKVGEKNRGQRRLVRSVTCWQQVKGKGKKKCGDVRGRLR
jgi:hypothetical protein